MPGPSFHLTKANRTMTPRSLLRLLLAATMRGLVLVEIDTPESSWAVPAITAGTPAGRVFRDIMPFAKYQYRTGLRIYNRSGVLLTLTVNGNQRKIGGSDIVTVPRGSVGPIYAYSLDAASNTNSGTIEVLEIGGLTVAD